MEQISLLVTCPQCGKMYDFSFTNKEMRRCPNCNLGIPEGKPIPSPSSKQLLSQESKEKWTKYIEKELSQYMNNNGNNNGNQLPSTACQDKYTTKWNSDHPGHIVFLLDLSGSMAEGDAIDYLIDSVQTTIENLLTHCRNDKGGPAERVEVSIYGYNYQIVELWKNYSVKMMTQAMIEAEENDSKIFDRNSNAKPEYQTCMRLAFVKAKADVEEWIGRQIDKEDIPAPIVINVTDGFPYEGKNKDQNDVYKKTLQAAQDLMSIFTNDGHVRVFNIHYDPNTKEKTVRFPCEIPTNENMQFLYNASSPLTDKMIIAANNRFGFEEAKKGSHALISNEKDPGKLASFLDWGSSQGVKPIPDAR